jgi:hypothetical protein
MLLWQEIVEPPQALLDPVFRREDGYFGRVIGCKTYPRVWLTSHFRARQHDERVVKLNCRDNQERLGELNRPVTRLLPLGVASIP